MKLFRRRIVLYSYVTLGVFLFEIIFPATASALTGGPSTPEVQSFEPIGTSDMVDIFSGDFKYNIPLMEVDGYPVNISYSGGVNMDQEASWVGLGWNLNPGAINRNMRGLPDDFRGDEVVQEMNIRKNWTFGLKAGFGVELLGAKLNKFFDTKAEFGVNYNNYMGAGIDLGLKLGVDEQIMNKVAPGLNAGLNINYSGNSGLTFQPNLNYSFQIQKQTQKSLGISGGLNASAQFNSRTGMKSLNFGYSIKTSQSLKSKLANGAAESSRKTMNVNRSLGFSGSAIEYGSPTYTPSINNPMNTFAFNFDVAFVKEIFGSAPGTYFGAYYTQQSIKHPIQVKQAYGYRYLEHANDESIMDLNREKDMPFSENHKNLAVPVHTPDIYSVTGHGIGGTFRLYRNDNVNYREAEQESNGNDIGVGFEIGALKTFKGGLNLSYTKSGTKTGNWYTDNILQEYAKTIKNSDIPNHPEYEPAYFKQMGEPSISNTHYNPAFQGYSLIAPSVYYGETSRAYTLYENKFDPTGKKTKKALNSDPTQNIQTERQPRNMLLYGLNAFDASYFANQRYLQWFTTPNEGPSVSGQFVFDGGGKRVIDYKKEHHISEMNVVGADGTRYIYGIPAYNITQTEITFAANQAGANCKTGLISYIDEDITPDENNNGKDHFVQKVTTPGYPYAYLLTGIVSPDYVDLRHDGITDDDLGTATRFNYFKAGDFDWRVPFAKDSANYSPANRYDNDDDKGSIIYGVKEVFYMHSIEGKNHIAVFYVQMRADAAGVANINGGHDLTYAGGDISYKLDSIVLYNKQDYKQNGASAYKIKGVHFDYDYALCGQVPNFLEFLDHTEGARDNDNGKLTLRSIHFTYGNSFKGKLSPYKFSYNNDYDGVPITYDSKAQDRWGVYAPGNGAVCSVKDPNSGDYPFTTQNQSSADLYAAAWCLKEITLPSGGLISVDYEADSYGYVQNKRAMRMFKIAGFSPTNQESAMSDLLFSISENQVNTFVFFELGEALGQLDIESILDGIEEVQFTVLADINGKGKYEYVKGYFELDQGEGSFGICSTNNQLGYLRMKWVPIRDNGSGKHVSPISMNIWNWSRINTPDLIYNRHVSSDDDFVKQAGKAFYEMVGLYNEIINMAVGLYANMRMRGFGQKVHLESSWIRLNAKGYEKLGGGHRVKSIRISDNWAIMGAANTVADDAEYGQEYDYTISESLSDGSVKTISSGVAQYEPSIGGDENPLHMPSYVREEYRMAPDIMYMNDQPYGESFMPPASVGYRQVTVRNLAHTGVKKSATGKQVFQFYTAKEFPVIISESDMQVNVVKPSFLDQIFNINRLSETKVTAGQGYMIELNDMHGKPKAEYTYSETSLEPIGGVIHDYMTNPNNPNELANTVKVVSANGSISTKEIATEVEVYNDYRQSLGEVTTASVQMNLDFFTISIIPFLLPSLYGGYSKSFNKVQTAVTVKVINRYGIEHKTTAIKEGSRIKTENLLYDEISGNVLVSSIQNEFDDNIYNITKPAHWAYDEGMGPAYKNVGIELNSVNLWQDSIVLPNGLNVRDYLVPGDYVLVLGSVPTICQVYEGKNKKLNLIGEVNGAPYYSSNLSKEYTLRVIRSGRKNMHNLPIEQISALHNPTLTSTLSIDSVISTSAMTYKQEWPFYCDSYFKIACDTTYGLPIDDLQDYFNLVFAATSFKAGKAIMDTSCIRQKLYDWDYEFRDTLYTKVLSEAVYVLQAANASTCLACQDSIFIEIGENQFYGIHVSQFSDCINYSTCSTPDYGDVISNHALYTKMRAFWDEEFEGVCGFGSDTTFVVEIVSHFPDDNVGVTPNTLSPIISLNFGRCLSIGCGLTISLPDRTCYKRLVEITEISIVDEETFDMMIRVELPDGTYDTLAAVGESHCFPLMWVNCDGYCETPTTSTLLNPYRIGMLGNWRPHRSYAFVDTRDHSTSPRPRIDGTFTSYSPFWVYNSTDQMLRQGTSTKWNWAREVTKYTPFGNEIENQDALGRYSAAVFGFNYTLPIAVGGNAKYEQLAYEGFEENNLFWQNANCYEGHFTFSTDDEEAVEITDQISHSGVYSLKVVPGETASSTPYELTACESYVDPLDSNGMLWQNCNCVGKFSPKEGKYIISAWLKEGEDPTDTSYNGAKIQVKLFDGSSFATSNFYASGPIVDGWQRVFAEIEIGATIESVEIILVAATSDTTWFDDFRVHPFNSNMKTYAYDQITLRLLAELDENNFATYYEYDQEGALVRVKKETERGVMTLKEVRKQIVKNP